MSKIFITMGIALLASAALATLAAVIVGALQWVGAVAPLDSALPPQSLVVGGLFLGIPMVALGWGVVWFGRWLMGNRHQDIGRG